MGPAVAEPAGNPGALAHTLSGLCARRGEISPENEKQVYGEGTRSGVGRRVEVRSS